MLFKIKAVPKTQIRYILCCLGHEQAGKLSFCQHHNISQKDMQEGWKGFRRI